MIKTEKLSMLFTTEEVQTKALNEVTMQVERGDTRFTHFRFLLLRRQTGG